MSLLHVALFIQLPPGDPAAENNGLVFRLASDLGYIAHSKKLYPLCEFLRSLAIDKGLGQVEIENHVATQRFHSAIQF